MIICQEYKSKDDNFERFHRHIRSISLRQWTFRPFKYTRRTSSGSNSSLALTWAFIGMFITLIVTSWMPSEQKMHLAIKYRCSLFSITINHCNHFRGSAMQQLPSNYVALFHEICQIVFDTIYH